MPAVTESSAPRTDEAASEPDDHRFSLLVSGGTDSLVKVLTVLRQRRYVVRDLQVDLSGEDGLVRGRVAADGRDPALLAEQLRRIVPVERAEVG